jgi:DinB superfamily
MEPEPWMRGPIEGVSPLTAPILYTFQHAREDLAKYTDGLTTEQLWATPHAVGAVGFHIRHIGGSTDRLITYLQGAALTEAQLAFLQNENIAGASRGELLAEMDAFFVKAEAVVRKLDPATLSEPRGIGRKQLPSTVIGLLVHTAEHIQRHIGQAISAAKLARAKQSTIE